MMEKKILEEMVDISLQDSGYYEEREIDIKPIFEMYNKKGYSYYSFQVEFMKKYGNLEIHYKHPIWNDDMIIRLDPIKAQKTLTMDVVDEYNEFLRDELLIIGDIDKEDITIFLSKSGRFYGAYDDCIINWGNDFEKMLSDIFQGKKGELLIID